MQKIVSHWLPEFSRPLPASLSLSAPPPPTHTHTKSGRTTFFVQRVSQQILQTSLFSIFRASWLQTHLRWSIQSDRAPIQPGFLSYPVSTKETGIPGETRLKTTDLNSIIGSQHTKNILGNIAIMQKWSMLCKYHTLLCRLAWHLKQVRQVMWPIMETSCWHCVFNLQDTHRILQQVSLSYPFPDSQGPTNLATWNQLKFDI